MERDDTMDLESLVLSRGLDCNKLDIFHSYLLSSVLNFFMENILRLCLLTGFLHTGMV